MNKKGAAVPLATILLVVLIGAVLYFGGVFGGKQALEINLPSVADADQPEVTSCESTTTPTVNIKSFDKFAPGTALTEATNLYRRKGTTTWSTFTAGTGFTNLPVNTQYEYVVGVDTTDQTDNAYGPIGEFNTGCQEDILLEHGLYQDEIETSLTATFYNQNHDASYQTFSAGNVKDVYMKWEAGTNEVCGNPFLPDKTPNVVCMDLNSTVWDKPVKASISQGISVDGSSMVGQELNLVSQPLRHAAAAGKTTYCYEFPVITDGGQEVKVRMDADDSNAPLDDMTASLYCGNWYVNADTGLLAYGVEDEDGNAAGTDAADTLTMDFTA